MTLSVGRQSIQNRLKHIAQVSEPWSEIGNGLSNDRLGISLKKTFFAHTALLCANAVTTQTLSQPQDP